MINLNDFLSQLPILFQKQNEKPPWKITNHLSELIEKIIPNLDEHFIVENGIAIHSSAVIESGVVMKNPAIIMENCQIGANSYFREGVFLGPSVKVGANCEIKSSLICGYTAIAHLNYIGNSIIGINVNFEAGSIAANHFNEREIKEISIKWKDRMINTHSKKFGSLVGDGCKIGANAVLSPGTILGKNSIVKRLELIDQLAHKD